MNKQQKNLKIISSNGNRSFKVWVNKPSTDLKTLWLWKILKDE